MPLASICFARLVQRAALHQRRRLRQAVGEQQVVVVLEVGLVAYGRRQELDRDDVGALVQQLEEGVLAVGAGLAPDQRAGRRRRRAAVERHAACRSIPCRAAADRPGSATGAGRRG